MLLLRFFSLFPFYKWCFPLLWFKCAFGKPLIFSVPVVQIIVQTLKKNQTKKQNKKHEWGWGDVVWSLELTGSGSTCGWAKHSNWHFTTAEDTNEFASVFSCCSLTPSPSVPSAWLSLASHMLWTQVLLLQWACALRAYLELPHRVWGHNSHYLEFGQNTRYRIPVGSVLWFYASCGRTVII